MGSRFGGSGDTRILENCGTREARRDPLSAVFVDTAISIPGFGNHSHQLGIESVNPRPTTNPSRNVHPLSSTTFIIHARSGAENQ